MAYLGHGCIRTHVQGCLFCFPLLAAVWHLLIPTERVTRSQLRRLPSVTPAIVVALSFFILWHVTWLFCFLTSVDPL